MTTFETIWHRIEALEGETFRQIRGKKFTYKIVGNSLALDSTNQSISQKQLEDAFELLPLEDTISVQHLRAPSYIYAILMDPRVRRGDW